MQATHIDAPENTWSFPDAHDEHVEADTAEYWPAEHWPVAAVSPLVAQ